MPPKIDDDVTGEIFRSAWGSAPLPTSAPDSAPLSELRRLQDENDFLRSENDRLKMESANNHDTAQFFAQRYDDCARECSQLQAELYKRPPVTAPLWRRLNYLVTGR